MVTPTGSLAATSIHRKFAISVVIKPLDVCALVAHLGIPRENSWHMLAVSLCSQPICSFRAYVSICLFVFSHLRHACCNLKLYLFRQLLNAHFGLVDHVGTEGVCCFYSVTYPQVFQLISSHLIYLAPFLSFFH